MWPCSGVPPKRSVKPHAAAPGRYGYIINALNGTAPGGAAGARTKIVSVRLVGSQVRLPGPGCLLRRAQGPPRPPSCCHHHAASIGVPLVGFWRCSHGDRGRVLPPVRTPPCRRPTAYLMPRPPALPGNPRPALSTNTLKTTQPFQLAPAHPPSVHIVVAPGAVSRLHIFSQRPATALPP